MIKQTIKVGNSAGVLLPRAWLGFEVKVTPLRKPININKDVLNIVEIYLEDIIGIYLTGSYARGEQDKDSDIDILVITENKDMIIDRDRYHIIMTSLSNVKRALNENIITIYPLIREAKVILNGNLLKELKKIKIKVGKLKWHIDTSKSALRIVNSLLDLEKGKIVKANTIIYSLILRLREAYIVDCLLKDKKYLNRDLIDIVSKKINRKTIEEMYKIYAAERDNKKSNIKIRLEDARGLYKLVKEMIDKQEVLIYEKGKKN